MEVSEKGVDEVSARVEHSRDDPAFWEPSRLFLKISILFILVGTGAFLIVLLTIAPNFLRAIINLCMMLTAVVAWILLAKNKDRAAVRTLAVGIWTFLGIISFFVGGVNSTAIVIYPVIIFLIGWLISTRWAIWFALATTAMTLGFVFAERWGGLPPPLQTPPQMRWIVQATIFLLSAALIHYLVRSYRNRLEDKQALSDHLTCRTQDLEASHAELNRAQAVANVGSWVYDITNDLVRLSSETCRIMGLSEGTSESRDDHLAHVCTQDRTAVNLAWLNGYKDGSFDIEFRIRSTNETVWIRQKGEIEYSNQGRPLRAVGIIQDITSRKLADAKITAAQNQLKGVIDAIPDLLFEVGQSGRIYSYHSDRDDLLAAPPSVFLGQLMSDVVPAHVADACLSAIAEASEKNWSGGVVYPLQLQDKEHWFELSVAAKAVADDEHEKRFILLARDITARKIAEDEINNLAFYDPLTDLPNRRLLLDRMKQTLASSERNNKYGALLFIDLDGFKTLNDTRGHDTGDFLLQQVAQRLTACVREDDTVARQGGDEFVVMLKDLCDNDLESAAQAELVTEKIISELNRPYQFSSYQFYCTVSIGIALFSKHSATIENLLKQADLAMYQAKSAGGNAFHFYDPQMQAVIMARVALEAGLREAVRNEQLMLHYQAQFDGDRNLVGVEALVRWQHPERGLVLPNEFITVAEETGVIQSLGRWVLESACMQLARWAGQPEMNHLTMSVNVSPRQFHSKNFVDDTLAAIERTGANPHLLKLELTESLLVDDIEGVIAKMQVLKERGLSFSLDDFGTGYSSLFHLKRMPLEQLKIDRSFVQDILVDPNDMAIAKMVVALAESMGVGVIAEGVETKEQIDCLALQGCYAYQGYLFSLPLAIDDFEEFVKHVSQKK